MSNKSPKIDPEKKKKMALQAKGLLKKLEKNKQHYAILERLAVDLRGQNLSEFGIENVDNFAEKNRVYRSSGISRWELRLLESEKAKS